MNPHVSLNSLYLQCDRDRGGWPTKSLQGGFQNRRPFGDDENSLGPIPEQPGSAVAHLLCCQYPEVAQYFIQKHTVRVSDCNSRCDPKLFYLYFLSLQYAV